MWGYVQGSEWGSQENAWGVGKGQTRPEQGDATNTTTPTVICYGICSQNELRKLFTRKTGKDWKKRAIIY